MSKSVTIAFVDEHDRIELAALTPEQKTKLRQFLASDEWQTYPIMVRPAMCNMDALIKECQNVIDDTKNSPPNPVGSPVDRQNAANAVKVHLIKARQALTGFECLVNAPVTPPTPLEPSIAPVDDGEEEEV